MPHRVGGVLERNKEIRVPPNWLQGVTTICFNHDPHKAKHLIVGVKKNTGSQWQSRRNTVLSCLHLELSFRTASDSPTSTSTTTTTASINLPSIEILKSPKDSSSILHRLVLLASLKHFTFSALKHCGDISCLCQDCRNLHCCRLLMPLQWPSTPSV